MTIRIHRLTALLCLHVVSLMGSSLALAHGGEDHGDEGKSPAPTTAIAPRASAQSDDFDLVAVLEAGEPQGARLYITLDRFKTNEPVVGAKLEVDAGGQRVDGRAVLDDLGDAVIPDGDFDTHGGRRYTPF